MRNISLRTAMYGILFVGLAAATGNEISLSNFTPRIDNLPTRCNTVYNTKIEACVSSDFKIGATCSTGCLAGLAKIGAAVKTECDGVDTGETSIIGVFQNDIGINALCPNNQPATTTTSLSSSSTVRTTLQTSTKTSAPATTTAATSTGTAQASSTSSSGLDTDPNVSTATFATPTAEPTGAVPSTVTDPSNAPNRNSQLSNTDSGGGSPFDVVATGVAPRLRTANAVLAVVLAGFLCVAYV